MEERSLYEKFTLMNLLFLILAPSSVTPMSFESVKEQPSMRHSGMRQEMKVQVSKVHEMKEADVKSQSVYV